jgi:hypothetical protein
MKRILLAVMIIAFAAGCSTLSVNTDYSVDSDFSQFRTFQYQNSDNDVEASSPLVHERIVNAIRQGMTGSGLQEVDSDPDVYVTYHGSATNQLRFDTTYMTMTNWHRPGWHSGMGVTSASTRTTTITEGTLVIDIWDASTNSLVWRAIATDTLSRNPERNTASINRAVERAFRNFPPR